MGFPRKLKQYSPSFGLLLLSDKVHFHLTVNRQKIRFGAREQSTENVQKPFSEEKTTATCALRMNCILVPYSFEYYDGHRVSGSAHRCIDMLRKCFIRELKRKRLEHIRNSTGRGIISLFRPHSLFPRPIISRRPSNTEMDWSSMAAYPLICTRRAIFYGAI